MEPREARCGPNAGHSSGRPGAPSRCELAPLSRTGIFVIDMVVSSLLMYRVPASRKVEKPSSSDGKDKKVALTWEFRYGFVLHNYLTGWFLIDLLSVTERLTLTKSHHRNRKSDRKPKSGPLFPRRFHAL